MRKLDVVYIVKPGDNNEELRYSLRSLVNLPHRKVWIVGYTPRWVTGVESIPGNIFSAAQWNVIDNLRLAAVNVPADRFVIMNDDIFPMQAPELDVPLYRGPLADQIRRSAGWWRDSLEKTYAYLVSQGYDQPISYELHRPVVMERDKLLEIAKLAMSWQTPYPPQWRTLYGNLYKVGGVPASDGKIKSGSRKDWRSLPVLSTEDISFRVHEVGRVIRATFPQPSPYEGPMAPRTARPLIRAPRPRRPPPMYGQPVQ